MAGVLGGSVSTLLLHPLDLLKTRQAVHCNGESKAARAVYASVATAVRHIVRQEGGAKALYKGVGTNVAVAGTSWGLTFMRYVHGTHNRWVQECVRNLINFPQLRRYQGAALRAPRRWAASDLGRALRRGIGIGNRHYSGRKPALRGEDEAGDGEE